MATERPLTQEEIARRAALTRVAEEYVTITNKSTSQTVPIQLRAPRGMSFWTGEQSVNLYPRRSAKFPKSRLYLEQIENCQKSGLLRVQDSTE